MRGPVFVMLCAGAGCGARIPHPPDAPPAAPPALRTMAYPGEGAEFVLSFQGLLVGRVDVEVGTPGWVDGHHVVGYRSKGSTEGVVTLLGEVRWELETLIDVDHAVAVSDHEDTYLGVPGDDEHIVRDHSPDLDSMQHDIQSAVAAIRGWHSRPGDRAQLDMIFASLRVDVDIWDSGRGHTDNSLLPAVKYEGTIDHDTGFTAWMSDDADRVPLLVVISSKYGEVRVDLVEYRPPPA
jgi:hypothetical protein